MNQYQLVFNGTVADGHNVNEVKRNLATLFKIDETKIEQLFTSLPIVVKKNVDYDGAIKAQRVLRKAGAICQIEEAIQNIRPPVMEKAAQPPPPLTCKPPSLNSTDVDYIPDSRPATTEETPKEGVKGLGDIISGVVLIGIGFVVGGRCLWAMPTGWIIASMASAYSGFARASIRWSGDSKLFAGHSEARLLRTGYRRRRPDHRKRRRIPARGCIP